MVPRRARIRKLPLPIGTRANRRPNRIHAALCGVFWQVQDTLLEDIERIEVVRGPGATIWGANAVNAVINIITKSAKDTHGTLVSAGGGNKDQGIGSFRYGG